MRAVEAIRTWLLRRFGQGGQRFPRRPQLSAIEKHALIGSFLSSNYRPWLQRILARESHLSTHPLCKTGNALVASKFRLEIQNGDHQLQTNPNTQETPWPTTAHYVITI